LALRDRASLIGPKGQGFIQGWIKFCKEQFRKFYFSYYSGLPMEEEGMGEEHDTSRSRREMRKAF
jgi:hypothetical protein